MFDSEPTVSPATCKFDINSPAHFLHGSRDGLSERPLQPVILSSLNFSAEVASMTLAGIFLYGQDATLLETRRWVLETSGYRVRATTQFSEIGALICVHRVDLLILCHSLTGKECELSSALVRSRWPSVLTLVLAAGDASYPSEMAGMVLDAVEGPAKLVSTVAQLVPCGTTLDPKIRILPEEKRNGTARRNGEVVQQCERVWLPGPQ